MQVDVRRCAHVAQIVLHVYACVRSFITSHHQRGSTGFPFTDAPRRLRHRPCPSRLSDDIKLAAATLSCQAAQAPPGNASSQWRKTPRAALGAVATDRTGLELLLRSKEVGVAYDFFSLTIPKWRKRRVMPNTWRRAAPARQERWLLARCARYPKPYGGATP